MSTSILNIWITNLGDPCSITNDAASGLPHAWVVAVMRCDGSLLNWSETRYRFHSDDPWIPVQLHTPVVIAPNPPLPPGWYCDSIPTKDGHVEIEVPPGCYVLRGSMHTWFTHGVLYGNWATDRAIVQACCGHDACATLYAPSAPACWIPLLEMVLPLLAKHGIVDAATMKSIEPLKQLLKPELASQFERGEFDVLRRAFLQMEEQRK